MAKGANLAFLRANQKQKQQQAVVAEDSVVGFSVQNDNGRETYRRTEERETEMSETERVRKQEKER